MILIREWFKESQVSVPDHIDETIFYLGQNYVFLAQSANSNFLYNGNNISNNNDFENYLINMWKSVSKVCLIFLAWAFFLLL